MTEYENACVGCDYCLNCGATHTPYTVCDECGEDCRVGGKVYKYEGQELCTVCTEEVVNRLWKELTFSDKMNGLCWEMDEFSCREGAEAALDRYWDGLSLNVKIMWFEDDIEEVE